MAALGTRRWLIELAGPAWTAGLTVVLAVCGASGTLLGWGAQGHRVVATLAATRLTPVARQQVQWLLGPASLADVALWADEYRTDNYQTYAWHFVNMPSGAGSYDRDRDCPRQPGVRAGTATDRWRDCIVDRILYARERLANSSLDRADRAIALKFLVHLVGDLHQPFHVLGVERGGNGIPVSAFGSEACGGEAGGTRFPCNLHGVWDDTLIAHQHLDDRALLARLETRIRTTGLDRRAGGAPPDWTMESYAAANAALLPAHGLADEVYAGRQWPVIEERLALGGLRLATLLNAALTTAPPQ